MNLIRFSSQIKLIGNKFSSTDRKAPSYAERPQSELSGSSLLK